MALPGNKSALGNLAKNPVQPSGANRIVKWLLMFVGLVGLLNGCTIHQRINYEPILLSGPGGRSSHYKLAGKALVLTDSDDDQRLRSFASKDRFGRGPTLEIPFGQFAGGAATLAFGEVFTDGADWQNTPTPYDKYAVVVRPHVSSFSYQFEDSLLKPPLVVMEIEVAVTIYDSGGDLISENSYQSGSFREDPFDPHNSDDPWYSVTAVVHQKIHELMVRAAFDFANNQLQKIAPFLEIKP